MTKKGFAVTVFDTLEHLSSFAALALLALLGRTDARLDRRTIAADAESFTDLRAGG